MKLERKETLSNGQVIDAEWWAATKVFALIVACIAVGVGLAELGWYVYVE